MPVYRFDICENGREYRGDDVIEYADLAAAEHQAIVSACAMGGESFTNGHSNTVSIQIHEADELKSVLTVSLAVRRLDG